MPQSGNQRQGCPCQKDQPLGRVKPSWGSVRPVWPAIAPSPEGNRADPDEDRDRDHRLKVVGRRRLAPKRQLLRASALALVVSDRRQVEVLLEPAFTLTHCFQVPARDGDTERVLGPVVPHTPVRSLEEDERRYPDEHSGEYEQDDDPDHGPSVARARGRRLLSSEPAVTGPSLPAYRHRMRRTVALLAVLASASGCGSPAKPRANGSQTSRPPAASLTRMAASPVPVGWHRVAHLSFNPSHPNDSLVGAGWTARSTVRWAFQCRTVGAQQPITLVLQIYQLAHQAKSMHFSPSSPGWLQCPETRAATKIGTLTIPPSKTGDRGHDVNMMLSAVTGLDTTLTDGTVNYRVDAFERTRT
jgi:hypothetical protein